MSYDWIASLTLIASIAVLSKLGYYLVFKIPVLAQARIENRAQDKIKKAMEKYPPVIRATQKVGLITNLIFFIAIAPFVVTLDAQPWWQFFRDVFLILMVYDFFYYLTHRFIFHGNGYFRKIHALHHQARNPTFIDAHYVHPLETFVGIALFLGTIVLMSLILGTFHVATLAATFLIFTQLNIINHTHVDIAYSPYKTLSWITKKHAIHHENMHKGNYATITLLYDKLFGTLD